MIDEFELEDTIMAFDTPEDEDEDGAVDLGDDTDDAEGLEDEDEDLVASVDEEDEEEI